MEFNSTHTPGHSLSNTTTARPGCRWPGQSKLFLISRNPEAITQIPRHRVTNIAWPCRREVFRVPNVSPFLSNFDGNFSCDFLRWNSRQVFSLPRAPVVMRWNTCAKTTSFASLQPLLLMQEIRSIVCKTHKKKKGNHSEGNPYGRPR